MVDITYCLYSLMIKNINLFTLFLVFGHKVTEIFLYLHQNYVLKCKKGAGKWAARGCKSNTGTKLQNGDYNYNIIIFTFKNK